MGTPESAAALLTPGTLEIVSSIERRVASEAGDDAKFVAGSADTAWLSITSRLSGKKPRSWRDCAIICRASSTEATLSVSVRATSPTIRASRNWRDLRLSLLLVCSVFITAAGLTVAERHAGSRAVTIMVARLIRKENRNTSRLRCTSARRGIWSCAITVSKCKAGCAITSASAQPAVARTSDSSSARRTIAMGVAPRAVRMVASRRICVERTS